MRLLEAFIHFFLLKLSLIIRVTYNCNDYTKEVIAIAKKFYMVYYK
ncbi:MAG: hypothetical protein WBA54_12370 [Acidaminobacteraceae bacterium]